ncbi:MAG: sarcosine oxidase subunit delta [Sphingorhabdus sp.]
MLIIICPHCGPRDQIEFASGGEGDRPRPVDPALLSDEEWAEFLFMRRNPKGTHRERWMHSAGCRKWFTLTRDTRNHRFLP